MYWIGASLLLLWVVVLLSNRGLSALAKKFPRQHHWLLMVAKAFELPLRCLLFVAVVMIVVQEMIAIPHPEWGMRGLIVLGVVWALFRVRRAVAQYLRSSAARPTYFLARFSYFFAIAIVLFAVLLLIHHFGISLTNLFLLSGGAGMVLGIAFRKNFTGLFAGIMVQAQGLFSQGERILVPSLNVEGDVEQMGWSRLTLRNPEKRPIYLSNRHLAGAIVINASKRSHRVLEQQLYVRYRDLSCVAAIVDEIRALLSAESTVDKEEEVLVAFDGFGRHGLEIMVQACFFYFDEAEYRAICVKLLMEMQRIVERHGAVLVVPQKKIVSGELQYREV